MRYSDSLFSVLIPFIQLNIPEAYYNPDNCGAENRLIEFLVATWIIMCEILVIKKITNY